MADRLDADTAARVLRRAQQIDDTSGDPALDDGHVSPEALIAAGNEVGIDPDAVRDALAIERFEADTPDERILDRLAGARAVQVEHVVLLDSATALDRVERWLTLAHRMRCMRLPSGAVEARRRSDPMASMSRAVGAVAGDVDMAPIGRVLVEAQPVKMGATDDADRSLVRITADRSGTRARRLGGGGAAGTAAIGTAAFGIAGSFALWPVVAVPLVAGGVLISRSGAAHAERIETELLHILTAIDRGEQPAGLVGRAARSARSAIAAVRSPRR